jgi:hypothetical protein
VRLVAAVLAVAVSGCGGDSDRTAAPDHVRATPTPTPAPTATPRSRLVRARCAPDATNCAAVSGRVLYVEAVDPDGDGDAHFVLLGGDVTAPGVTAVDVERSLRPRRLPRPGDRVSAAGPVYTGSHGQQQIQATELHYAPRR